MELLIFIVKVTLVAVCLFCAILTLFTVVLSSQISHDLEEIDHRGTVK